MGRLYTDFLRPRLNRGPSQDDPTISTNIGDLHGRLNYGDS